MVANVRSWIPEFNLEANTLGSKSVDARSTNAAVELKVLIEQMREQVQHRVMLRAVAVGLPAPG